MSNFAKESWETLSAINVNEHTKKKGRLTYLSWVWAWQTLMDNYPESTYKWLKPVYELDQTMTVGVKVTLKKGDDSLSRVMLLPVMNNINKAIPKPNAFDINNARMRCFAKAISMFGLGGYIYAGEDIPEAEKSQEPAPQPRRPHKEHFDLNIEVMDSAQNIEMLRFLTSDAVKYFKDWGEADLADAIRAKGVEFAERFETEKAA